MGVQGMSQNFQGLAEGKQKSLQFLAGDLIL